MDRPDLSLLMTRILHAGYLFECAGMKIAIDPIFENPFSTNCQAFPDVRFDRDQIRRLSLEAVFISHFHDDHCSLDSLAFLDRRTPIHIFCIFEELHDMVRALGFTSVHALALDVPVAVGPFTVTPRRALDEDVDSILQIEAAGLRILDVVDAWIDPAMLRQLATQAPWDMVLWPFQTMRELEVLAPAQASPAPDGLPPEWQEQLIALAPRYVVPSSCQFQMEPWSWYNRAFFPISYAQFEREVGAFLPASKIVRLDPSATVRLDARSLDPAPPPSWIQPVGPRDVDYAYDPVLVPPSTAEVARHFPALNPDETRLVLDYCRGGLLERYRSLGGASKTAWKLSLFDHTGAVTNFHYAIDGDAIELTGVRDVRWRTEVPLAKLHGALVRGEALTSMYMRVDAGDEDVLEDPLIRCLFEGVFGAYQRAQLARY